MSETSTKETIVVEAREGKVLNFTPKGHIRMNPTRLNPRREEKGKNATLDMSSLFDYSYFNVAKKKIVFKMVDSTIEYSFYFSDVDVSKAS